MNETSKAVVTVIGKDMVGILAKVSTACAQANANVIEVTQSVLEDFFCMVMIIDITHATMQIEQMQKPLRKKFPACRYMLCTKTSSTPCTEFRVRREITYAEYERYHRNHYHDTGRKLRHQNHHHGHFPDRLR